MRQFVTFWASNRLYGVDIDFVKEINTEVSFSPIFHASEKVKGYVNIRGQIHLVLDLRLILGFDSDEKLEGKQVIIFKPSIAEPFGVLVDRVGDIIVADDSQIEAPPKEEGLSEEDQLRFEKVVVQSFCKLEKALLIVLDPRKFLNTIEIPVTKI